MKITSQEPAVVHSHFLVDATGHHLVVVIDIMYQMLHSELERTHILNYVWSLLLGTCTSRILHSKYCSISSSALLPIAHKKIGNPTPGFSTPPFIFS